MTPLIISIIALGMAASSLVVAILNLVGVLKRRRELNKLLDETTARISSGPFLQDNLGSKWDEAQSLAKEDSKI